MTWDNLADPETIEIAASALKANGFSVTVVENGAKAMDKVLKLIPKGSEVFTATSATIEIIGLAKVINESGEYDSVRKKLKSMDRNTQRKEMAKLGAVPDWVVGSVHAVTEDGKVVIASGTGSQLASYVYGAQHVIWVIGTQKIVKDIDQGIKRIYEHSLPLESERMRIVHGAPGSSVSKLLIFNKEFVKERITIILVKEVLGF